MRLLFVGDVMGRSGRAASAAELATLRARGGRYGIESMCVAGGMGQAMLIELL